MKKWTDHYTAIELILYEDKNLIVLNKPPTISTQDDQSGDLSISTWIENHIQTKLHLANRIDRPVSGIVLFAKNKKGIQIIRNSGDIDKRYVALVSPIDPEKQKLTHFIKREGRRKKAYISDEKKSGFKPSSLQYEVIHQLDNYHLLQIETFTGRFHQIRAQLAHIGYPIRGDVKYGARRANKDRSIDLHAYTLRIDSIGLKIKAAPLGRENIWQVLSSSNVI